MLKSEFVLSEEKFLTAWKIECDKEAAEAEVERGKDGNEIVDKEDS